METEKISSSWIDLVVILILPVIGLALGFGISTILGIQDNNISNLVVNSFFLLAGLLLLRIHSYSKEEIGLKIIPEKVQQHVLFSSIVLILYASFYIFVIKISGLRPFSTEILWGLAAYLVVVIAEELYFRGIIYRFLEKRYSSKIALVVSSLLFGIMHASQGLRGIVTKSITGWLWGSIRYSTGMIFLIIFPIHYLFNATWLLFEGNWNNPPTWASIALPAAEFLLGLIFFLIKNSSQSKQE